MVYSRGLIAASELTKLYLWSYPRSNASSSSTPLLLVFPKLRVVVSGEWGSFEIAWMCLYLWSYHSNGNISTEQFLLWRAHNLLQRNWISPRPKMQAQKREKIIFGIVLQSLPCTAAEYDPGQISLLTLSSPLPSVRWQWKCPPPEQPMIFNF